MTLKRKLAICAAGALALTGAGTALAAKGHGVMAASSWSRADHPRGPSHELAAAAAYLGVTQAELTADLAGGKTLAQVAAATSGKSVDGLVAALVAAEKTELDAAVAAGRLTAAQEASVVSTLQQRFTDVVNGVRPAGGMHGGPGMPGMPGRGHDELAAAAAYLGLTQAELQADRAAGKTLAQVAAATSGKSVDGLVAALVAAEKTELDAAVAAGRLTAAQEASVVSTLQQRVTDLVNGVRPAGGMHGPGGGFRP